MTVAFAIAILADTGFALAFRRARADLRRVFGMLDQACRAAAALAGDCDGWNQVATARGLMHRRAERSTTNSRRWLATAIRIARELRAERDELRVRRDALLDLAAKLTRETPYPAELEECRSGRRALIAEVGTLRARVAALHEAIRGHNEHHLKLAKERDEAKRELSEIEGNIELYESRRRQELADTAAQVAAVGCRALEEQQRRAAPSSGDLAAAKRFLAWAVDDLEAAEDPTWYHLLEGEAVVRKLLAIHGGTP